MIYKGDIVRWKPDVETGSVDLGTVIEMLGDLGTQVDEVLTSEPPLRTHWFGYASNGWFPQDELRVYCAGDKLW